MSAASASQNPTAGAGRRAARDAAATTTPATTRTTSSTSGKGSDTPINSASRSRSGRTPGATTPVSARAALRKPTNGSSNATNAARNGPDVDEQVEADAKAQTTAAIQELQESLRLSEEACEEHQKQIALLQARAEDSADEQRRLEETIQDLTDRLEASEQDRRDSLRSKRELETVYESECATSLRFKEEARVREEALAETIQRLKDSLASRTGSEDGRRPDTARTTSSRSVHSQVDGSHFAPGPTSPRRSDSRSSSHLVLQKDKMIESLRIELAEAQIKLVEMENMGGGQVQELEKSLMETRMVNARLMEENDSFQLLLSEKTLSGELSHSGLLQKTDADATPTAAGKGASLEDELELADQLSEDDPTREFKIQIATLRDENKALTLYINNIISRLLQHDFEFILDKNAEAPTSRTANRGLEKDLPPPPAEDENVGFLAKTRSYMGGRKPRPQSAVFTNDAVVRPTAHEDPATAPSIPIGRPQPRSTSGGVQKRTTTDWNSAAVVDRMYRGPSPSGSTGPLSPSITSPRGSFFGTRPANPPRVTSSGSNAVETISEDDTSPRKINRDSKLGSSRNSVASDTSGSLSGPQSAGDSGERAPNSVLTGSKMRPLRLVQEKADDAAARKAANRTSWMGWFNAGKTA